MYKDIRARAEQSAHRRKKRGKDNKRDLLGGSPTVANKTMAMRPREPSQSSSLEETVTRQAQSARQLDQSLLSEKEEVGDDEKSDAGTVSPDVASTIATPSAPLEESGRRSAGKGDDCGDVAASPTEGRLARGKLSGSTADVTDEDIDKLFLRRYKMSRDELQVMADNLHIHPSNLCFLKQEFDAFDTDQTGYIETRQLKGLLRKLGEDLPDSALDQAFKQLDGDGSGEIEFFEFAEWFTSSD